MNRVKLNSHLWDFSLWLYRQPEVEPLCLKLQDEWGADVNILLWLCWLEREGLAINTTRLHLAQAHVAPWHTDVVLPLRRIRRHIKRRYGTATPAVEASRQAVKAAELQAERAAQGQLEKLARAWLASAGTRPVPRGANLAVYAQSLALPDEVELNANRVLGRH